MASDAASVNTSVDENTSRLVPYSTLSVSEATYSQNFDVTPLVSGKWTMGNAFFVDMWDYSTLQQGYQSNDTWADKQEVFQLPKANQWMHWVIQTHNASPHPMHYHGPLLVLESRTSLYDASTADISLTDGLRRDVVLLPGGDFVVIAFYR